MHILKFQNGGNASRLKESYLMNRVMDTRFELQCKAVAEL